MSDTITLTGIVATTPRHLVTGSGLAITSFRQLALNVQLSIRKGEHVVVTGRLRIRDWASGERTGTTIEVEADSIGHDLGWCTTTFVRSVGLPRPAAEPGQADDSGRGESLGENGPERAENPAEGPFPGEEPALARLDS